MYPEITFRVNLVTQNRLSTVAPTATLAEAENFKNTRSSYINVFNIGGNVQMAHDGTFTVSGEKAAYLKRTFVSSPASPEDLLVIVE